MLISIHVHCHNAIHIPKHATERGTETCGEKGGVGPMEAGLLHHATCPTRSKMAMVRVIMTCPVSVRPLATPLSVTIVSLHVVSFLSFSNTRMV